MMYFNSEHYPDPTAAEAMERVMLPGRNGPEADEEGVCRLAEAVVAEAVRDYADLVRSPWRSEALLKDKRELEAFFLGSWFRCISGLDGAAILRRIREEVLRSDRT